MANTLKTTTAAWIVECNVECPHCGAYIDLTAIPDMFEVLPQACETESDANIHVDCPDCKNEFIVTAIEY